MSDTYEVFHAGRQRWIEFTYCTGVQDAKTRFQWRFGYWPQDEHVRRAR